MEGWKSIQLQGPWKARPGPQGDLRIAAPRQGVLRAQAVAPATLGPATRGFSFLPVQPFPVIVGQTPSMTHLGFGFLVPAFQPSPPQLLGAPRPADLAPHHLGRRQSPAELGGGLRKELGLCQPQAPPTPSCLCESAHPLPPAGGPLSARPIHPPRTTCFGKPCPVPRGDCPSSAQQHPISSLISQELAFR